MHYYTRFWMVRVLSYKKYFWKHPQAYFIEKFLLSLIQLSAVSKHLQKMTWHSIPRLSADSRLALFVCAANHSKYHKGHRQQGELHKVLDWFKASGCTFLMIILMRMIMRHVSHCYNNSAHINYLSSWWLSCLERRLVNVFSPQPVLCFLQSVSDYEAAATLASASQSYSEAEKRQEIASC